MMVTVRPLGVRLPAGAAAGGSALSAAVKAITDYLREDAGGTLSEQVNAATKAAAAKQPAGPGGYYAEAAAGEHRARERWWRRGGVGSSVSGEPDAGALNAVLFGRDPVTGVDLMGRSGERPPPDPPVVGETVTLTAAEAATVLNVTARRVRQMAEAGEDHTKRANNRSWIAGRKDARGAWVFASGDVDDAKRRRDGRSITLGIEVTFSAPKSVSLLWAGADEDTRAKIDQVWDEAVGAGLDYLADHGLQISVGSGPNRQYRKADGVYIAGFRHASNRHGEPQLHEHCVIANMGDAGLADATARALDMRGTWTHATTAGYLAGATLRKRLAKELGVSWETPDAGLADIAGVPKEVLARFSSRRRDILAMLKETGLGDSINAREVASLATRPDKDVSESLDDMFARWGDELADAGFDAALVAAGQRALVLPTEEDIAGLFRTLLSTDEGGLVHYTPTFDRRDVIQAITLWANDRLDAGEILDLCDRFLSQAPVVALKVADTTKLPPRGGAPFTVTALLDDGSYITHRYRRPPGGRCVVSADLVEDAIAGDGTMTLGADQAAMVRSVCGSGLDVQSVIGPAGSGKTVALRAAAAAWSAAGHSVTGAAVGGTAADVLGRSTGIPTRTVASLLTHIANGAWPAGDVLLLDEAGTLGDRAHALILRAAEAHGAIVRTIGDPRQHGSVEAGGMWAHVAEASPHTAELVENRRQQGPEMADVRQAVALFRSEPGEAIAEAFDVLEEGGRVVTEADPREALTQIVEDWWKDELAYEADPATHRRGEMLAEHHEQRRELCLRAQAILREEGVLSGTGLPTEDGVFYGGDRVVCRHAWRTRSSDGRWVAIRNGHHGTVRSIRWDLSGGPGLVVEWDDGNGVTMVTQQDLSAQIRPGVTGIVAPSYARTSHSAQGSTYSAARMVIDTRTSRAGVYVGATRGSDDLRFYTLDVEALSEDDDDDPWMRSFDTRMRLPATQAIIEQLRTERSLVVPAADDPAALRVAQAAAGDVDMATLPGDDAERAERMRRRLRDGAAIHTNTLPDAVGGLLGDRPDAGRERAAWDGAVRCALDALDRVGVGDIDAGDVLGGDSGWQEALRHLRTERLAAETPEWRMRAVAAGDDPLLGEVLAKADRLDVWRTIVDPPDHLLDALGSQPGTTAPAQRERWLERAAAIETWRRTHCRVGGGGPLIPPPPDDCDAHVRRFYDAAIAARDDKAPPARRPRPASRPPRRPGAPLVPVPPAVPDGGDLVGARPHPATALYPPDGLDI